MFRRQKRSEGSCDSTEARHTDTVRCLPSLRMDYIDKSNLIGDQRYSDRLTYDGTWENNLFNFIRMVVPRLTRELSRPFQMDGIIRNGINDTG